jgi:transcriptional regulator with XRE-family HTH domain
MTDLNMEYLKTIGKRISELRESKGVTQEVLSRTLGIPRSTLAKYETGLQDFKSETIIQMCDYFSVSADYLLRGASAQALDIHRRTGLTDAALNSLENEKTVVDVILGGDDTRIDLVNELLSDKDFFYLLEEFVLFRHEWRTTMSKLAGSDKTGAKEHKLRERIDFLHWKYSQQVGKYIERLLEGK